MEKYDLQQEARIYSKRDNIYLCAGQIYNEAVNKPLAVTSMKIKVVKSVINKIKKSKGSIKMQNKTLIT